MMPQGGRGRAFFWAASVAGLSILLGTSGVVICSKAETPQRVLYVGALACRRCHLQQHRSWRKTLMAQAFELLRPGVRTEAKRLVGLEPEKDYTGEPACLECHTTGYGKPGGFTSEAETPDKVGVQCEACHGAGGGEGYLVVMTLKNRRHSIEEMWERGLIFPVPARHCIEACHNQRSPHNEKVDVRYRFDWDERVRKGVHGHWKLQYDHGPLPESYFQTLHPELLNDAPPGLE